MKKMRTEYLIEMTVTDFIGMYGVIPASEARRESFSNQKKDSGQARMTEISILRKRSQIFSFIRKIRRRR